MHMNAEFYKVKLDALQSEAKRLGYYFARSDTAAIMPPLLACCLAESINYHRDAFLYPKETPADWEESTRFRMNNGYAEQIMTGMIKALDTLGLRLQETPEAVRLLADEELRRREQESAPDDLSLDKIPSGFYEEHGDMPT